MLEPNYHVVLSIAKRMHTITETLVKPLSWSVVKDRINDMSEDNHIHVVGQIKTILTEIGLQLDKSKIVNLLFLLCICIRIKSKKNLYFLNL
jgi:hypothetical protein